MPRASKKAAVKPTVPSVVDGPAKGMADVVPEGNPESFGYLDGFNGGTYSLGDNGYTYTPNN